MRRIGLVALSLPKDKPITTFESFRLDPKSKLLYFRDSDEGERLCIPDKLWTTFARIAHDDRAHVGGNRTYDFLRRNIFALRLKKKTDA